MKATLLQGDAKMWLITQSWGRLLSPPHSFTPGWDPVTWTSWGLFALIRGGFDGRSGPGPAPSLVFHKHTRECYSSAFLPSSLPPLCPLNLLLLTVHPHIWTIYLPTASCFPPSYSCKCFIVFWGGLFAAEWRCCDNAGNQILDYLLRGCWLDPTHTGTHWRVIMEAYLVFLLLHSGFLRS